MHVKTSFAQILLIAILSITTVLSMFSNKPNILLYSSVSEMSKEMLVQHLNNLSKLYQKDPSEEHKQLIQGNFYSLDRLAKYLKNTEFNELLKQEKTKVFNNNMYFDNSVKVITKYINNNLPINFPFYEYTSRVNKEGFEELKASKDGSQLAPLY